MAFARLDPDGLWPDGIVPYVITEGDFSNGEIETIGTAIRHWNENTVLRLVPFGGEDDHVVFEVADDSCSSRVGRIGGPQVIGCDVGDGFGVGSVIHEIGHAIGLYHEHVRPDRDLFVEIRWRSIRGCPDDADGPADCGGCAADPAECGCTQEQVDGSNCEVQGNFVEEDSGKILTPYDFDSIMHYGRGAFSKPGSGDTVIPEGGQGIGQRGGLSELDIRGVCVHYGAPHFAVVWKDAPDFSSKARAHFVAMTRWGKPCGSETAFSDRELGGGSTPSVDMDPMGRCVVAWDQGPVGSREVRVRGLEADGTGRFDEMRVSDPNVDADAADVAMDADGSFVVVWQQNNGTQEIVARGYDGGGTARFPQITVSSPDSGTPGSPSVAVAPNGRFVVAWGELENESLRVKARGFNAVGVEAFSEVTVATGLGDQDVWPRVALRPDGSFVVVWERSLDDVMARGFNADGSDRFAELRVNARPTGRQFRADLAETLAGGFIVTWTDDANENFLGQIRSRGLTIDGALEPEERTINTRGGGDQRWARVATASDGRYYVVWQDDEDRNGVYQVKAEAKDAGHESFLESRTINTEWIGQQWAPSVASR